jgi:CheY-like chemotaxis protein
MSANTNATALLAPPARAEGERVRVLIADDEVALRTLLARVLARDGYAVTAVGTGGELVRAARDAHARRRPFDLILSDVHMPEMTGTDALRALGTLRDETPTLLMTARRDEDVLRDASEAGALGVLQKPFELDVVRAAIAALTARRPSR